MIISEKIKIYANIFAIDEMKKKTVTFFSWFSCRENGPNYSTDHDSNIVYMSG